MQYPTFLSKNETEILLDFKKTFINQKCKEGVLHRINFGHSVRITFGSVVSFAANRIRTSGCAEGFVEQNGENSDSVESIVARLFAKRLCHIRSSVSPLPPEKVLDGESLAESSFTSGSDEKNLEGICRG